MTGLAAALQRDVRWPWYLGAIFVLLLLPVVLGTPYWRGILIVCAMNVLLAMSLNLVIGYTGQLNLGQSGFFAIGAYVTTVLLKSYGWNFWLACVAALATQPKLFMLDEPAAGLNAAEVAFLLQRLRDIRDRGITVVVVEHNMDLVMKVADHVFVMDHGEFLFEGPPKAVQSNPRVIEAYLGGEFESGALA